MRKILSILVVALLVGGGFVYADGGSIAYTRGGDARVLTDLHVGVASSGTLSTAITSANHVLGWTYTDSAAGGAALYDVATVAARATSNQFSEIYVAAGTEETIMFPMPRDITNGLVSACATTGFIVIYYE